MAKKVIGIPGWVLGDNTFGCTKSYLNYIAQFGKPLILTPAHEEIEDLDLLVLPGGADLSPGTYGATPNYWTGSPNMMLEWFDMVMLPKYIQAEIPIFGICRGAQRLWTVFGGKMDQHNGWHTQSKASEPWEQCHDLFYTEKFKKKYGQDLKKVNSRHHQTMDASQHLPQDLEIIAFAGGNKPNSFYPEIVELFQHKTLPIFGIQGHPEDMVEDDLSGKIIEGFLEQKLVHI